MLLGAVFGPQLSLILSPTGLRHCCLPADWGGLGAAPGPATLTTASGRTISGDWVIKAVGIRPATTAFAAALGQEQLASNGALMVEPTLQVRGETWAGCGMVKAQRAPGASQSRC